MSRLSRLDKLQPDGEPPAPDHFAASLERRMIILFQQQRELIRQGHIWRAQSRALECQIEHCALQWFSIRALDPSRELQGRTRRLATVLTRNSLLHAKIVLDEKIKLDSMRFKKDLDTFFTKAFQKPVGANVTHG